MKLSKIIENTKYKQLLNFNDVEITGISYNSKTVEKGNLFVCLKGEYSDGHDYAKMAFDNGAAAFLTEKELDIDAPQIIVESTRHRIADVASAFYEYPSKNLKLIGVTGTNGKTTVTHLIQRIIEDAGKKCAIIGTLGYKMSGKDSYHDAKHTTPQAPELQKTLKKMLGEKIDCVAMEVSSHALEQNRVGGCFFDGAVFTNLTQDHLDYHITMNNYFEAKAILFKNLQPGCFAIINNDDEYAQKFIAAVPEGVKTYTYGIKKNADVTAENIEFSIHGAKFDCIIHGKKRAVNLQMNGMFSVYNVLAAVTSALAMGIELKIALKALENVKGVAGRFEVVAKKPLVIVDYAHTPDGLENVLNSAREITPKDGKLICLFGCGGDRDATKRPKMGAIAEKIADKIVITSDNPRSEDPQQIITDIIAGLKSVNPDKVTVEPDRGHAIALLKDIADNNDVVVIAGKGHEDYQILKDRTIHFDDREEARKVFEGSVI